MPYFNFDLVIGAEFKNQGGMILENTENAIDKADSLASELCIVRPELCSTGCAVRVTDGDSNEFYRTPVDPIPAWLKSSRRARRATVSARDRIGLKDANYGRGISSVGSDLLPWGQPVRPLRD
jgi:hypothetical protein